MLEPLNQQASKRCNLCRRSLSAVERPYFIKYGESTINPLNTFQRKGEICLDCCMKIDKFIQELKK